jgi:F-type H+-transporting ATPase subunit b
MLNFSVTFFITLINLGVLFLILSKILYKPVTKFMADREARIRTQIDAAAKSNEEAKKAKQQHEDELNALRKEQSQLVQSARAEGQRQADKIIEGAKQDAARIAAQAKKQLEAEKQEAWAIFQQEAAALVVAAAAKLLRREITSADARTQAAMFLEAAGKEQGVISQNKSDGGAQ